ncbi:hypothetical protein BKA64DRAFT_124885 [Cadophora sp. MPI-SDFR-AT-0126]|nr:hypothetical protein BKA64DRAFT_124885 [Leotiomycetes sp. MPI-SDFR-AT-0126]
MRAQVPEKTLYCLHLRRSIGSRTPIVCELSDRCLHSPIHSSHSFVGGDQPLHMSSVPHRIEICAQSSTVQQNPWGLNVEDSMRHLFFFMKYFLSLAQSKLSVISQFTMHFSRTLLPALVVFSPLSLGNPLKIGLSAKITNKNLVFQAIGKQVSFRDAEQVSMDNAVASTATTFSNHAVSSLGNKDTAKYVCPYFWPVIPTSNWSSATFWNELYFKGEMKGHEVSNDKCFNLPKNLTNRVESVKLEPKISYCSSFAKEACEFVAGSDKMFNLQAGEYAILFPEGMDFVSFNCKLSEQVRFDALSASGSRQSPASHPSVSFTKSGSNGLDSPFEVQMFLIPGFQGPSSIKEFVPGQTNCFPLASEPEIRFRSITLGEAIQVCYFFPVPDSRGPVVLERDSPASLVPMTGLRLRSIKYDLKGDSSTKNAYVLAHLSNYLLTMQALLSIHLQSQPPTAMSPGSFCNPTTPLLPRD